MATISQTTDRVRGHFRWPVPRRCLSDAMRSVGLEVEGKDVVLETERGMSGPTTSLNGKVLDTISYPESALVLSRLLLRPEIGEPDWEEAILYLPKGTFNRIADADEVARLAEFEVTPGAACEDDILANIEDCLKRAMRLPDHIRNPIVDDLVNAIQVHVARLYAGMSNEKAQAIGGLAPWQLRRTKTLIEQHLAEPLYVEQLAEACGLSPGHFSRQFASCTGMPPRRWIMRRRIETACEKLVSTDISLADLALSCGFADQSHFTRTFASITGEAPGRWRRETRARQSGEAWQRSGNEPDGARLILLAGVQVRRDTQVVN